MEARQGLRFEPRCPRWVYGLKRLVPPSMRTAIKDLLGVQAVSARVTLIEAQLRARGSIGVEKILSHSPIDASTRSLALIRRAPADPLGATRPFLPNLFILGAAKSGTTSVHAWLAQHPQICMSNPKEPFFFEAEFDLGLRHYHDRYFPHWKGEPIVGESRHRNLYLPFVAPRVFSINPSAKLLLLLREPVRRAISHWWHWHSQGLDPLAFDDAVAADLKRISDGFRYETALEAHLYSLTLEHHGIGLYRSYVDSGYYDEQLARYLTLFDRRQIKVVIFEEAIADPRQTLREILEFLEVDREVAERIELWALNQAQGNYSEGVSSQACKRLSAHYAPHNRRLEELLGRSIPCWGVTE